MSVVPSLPLIAKVTIPAPTTAYVPRASLLRRLDSVLERPLTVLQAPAGFGKTTVLADVSRRTQKPGVIVGWLSLDEDDTPSVLGSYIAGALEHAGLGITVLDQFDAWSSAPFADQMGVLIDALQRHRAPCLLVLDEVDRLPDRSVDPLDRLLKRLPAELHLAIAFRSNPGLDLATHVLDGSATVVGTEQFRFSRAEVGRLFGSKLSRRELIDVQDRTAGWPVALSICRNERVPDKAGSDADTERLASNFVEARLLRELPAEVRTGLLDLSVFDRIEADLVDEVLGTSDSRLRIVARSELDGLLPPIDKTGAARRMHPLVKACCLNRLSAENPARKRSLHAAIAGPLARRGRLIPALRHARAAGDSRLVGRLIEDAGVFRTWLRGGGSLLVSADRLLAPELVATHPRCALLRCIVLRMALRLDEARGLYETVSRATEEVRTDQGGDDARGLAVDRVFAHAVLAGGSCQSLHNEVDGLPPAGDRSAGSEGRDLARHVLLCVSHFERASLDDSRRHGMKAQTCLSGGMRYGHIFIDLYLGMVAMVQGQVDEAAGRYARARRDIRGHFSSDPCLSGFADVVTVELDLERNRERAVQQRTLKNLTDLRGGWFEVYAVAVAVSAELMLGQYGGDSTIRLLMEALDDVKPMGDGKLSKYLAALLACCLVEVGHPDEAARVWRDRALPSSSADLLDLCAQPWRTMEAISCARIRLLAAQGEFTAAAALAGRLCGTASKHGLTRTLLRGLALSMVVAQRAGAAEQAQARLLEFLRFARKVAYVRPLVRDREVSRVVLLELLDTDCDPETRAAAESMLPHLGERTNLDSGFSPRELQVLVEIRQGRDNRAIADRLGISEAGVRYHLRNIYRKTGARRREDIAQQGSRAPGALP